jgi:hypothetical protein
VAGSPGFDVIPCPEDFDSGNEMGAPVGLREDSDARELRCLAAKAKDADQTRRLPALAAVYDGMSRESHIACASTMPTLVMPSATPGDHPQPSHMVAEPSPGNPIHLSVRLS